MLEDFLSSDRHVQHQSEGGEGGIRNCVVQYHGEKLTVFMMTNKKILVLNNVVYLKEGVRRVTGEEQARCDK